MSLSPAENQFADMRADYLNSFVKLYAALGGGWISEEEMLAEQEARTSAEKDAKESGEEVAKPKDSDVRNELFGDFKERSKKK